MQNPFTYRPVTWDVDLGLIADDEVLDWEDNWLSNALAWASDTFMPNACENPEGWMTRVSIYFWAECPCCLFWRGALFGATIGGAAALVVTAIA